MLPRPKMKTNIMNDKVLAGPVWRLFAIGLAAGLASTACVPEGHKAAGSGGGSGTGGRSSSGGAVGTGGRSNSGGANASGGLTGAGGQIGDAGTTGTAGAGGSTGTGGDVGTGGAGGMVMLLPCGITTAVDAVYNASLASNVPLITDFTYTAGAGINIFFGDTYNQVTGLTYHFPDRVLATGGAGGGGGVGGASGAGGRGGVGGGGGRGGAGGAPAAGPPGLTEDVTASNWHITGVIAPGQSAYAFVMRFTCTIDASAYSGIEFTVGGNAGPANSLTLQAGFNDDLPPMAGGFGTGICPPTGCASPSTILNVTPAVTTVQIPWSRFVGGRPMNTVNPAQLVQFLWAFTIRAAAYNVDFVIDDLRFYTAPADAGTAN